MSRRRIKTGLPISFYHLMSRTVNGEAWFGEREKEVFRKMMHQVADFSGVRVVTYAVMKNHFHLLVEIQNKPEKISDQELVRRFTVLYPEPTPWQPMSGEVLEKVLKENTLEAKLLRTSLLRRMNDASWLMKTLKQRFSIWFNKSRERFGPVWSDRFKSVLVQGEVKTLRTVAAYIDLNAVRSGLVSDPKDYRFCGYGEAVAGSRRSREGLAMLSQSLSAYRMTLYGKGSAPQKGKAYIDPAEALRVIEKESGELPLHILLRCHIRFFTDGIALGSSDFIKKIADHEYPDKIDPSSPKVVQGVPGKFLHALTGLRKNAYRAPENPN